MKTYVKLYNFFTAPRDEDEGAGMVEYALLVGLIGVMLVGALTVLRGGIGNLFNKASNTLNTAG